MNKHTNQIQLLGKRCFSQSLIHNYNPVNFSDYEYQHGDPYQFYKKIGYPKYFVAPMVDQSELPYRMMTRKYKADICFTPMYHAKLFSTTKKYRQEMFKPCAEDRPLIV
jgi:hypothetical protein